MKKIVSFALVLLMLVSFAACGNGSDTKTYTFTLMFLADGNIIQRANYSVGDTVSAPVNVKKEGYTFVGWAEEVPVKMPARDLYINAIFEKNTYKVSYFINDILVHEDAVLYGDKIPEYTVPEAEYGKFSGWDAVLPEKMPANDIVLHGTADEDTYLLTFVVNGKICKADVYRSGQAVAVPEDPAVEGYDFLGWDSVPETMPEHDVTVTAVMKAQTFRLSYYSASENGYLLNSVEVEFGTVLSDIPAITPVAPEGKIFSGWMNMPETMPANDVSVYPVWEDANYECTVSYYVNGTLYKTQTYVVGAAITAPENPADVEGFAGWKDLPEKMPANDISVEAVILTHYLLAFYTDEDTLYMSMQIPEGAPLSVFIPKAPIKEGYTFISWDADIPEKMPANDLKLTAVWEKEGNLLKFYDGDPAAGGQLISSESVAAGNAITYPDALSKEGYTFIGWSESTKTMPEDDRIVYAVWEANKYIITYVSSLDEPITVECDYGTAVEPLVPAEHYGYEFGGWVGIPEVMPSHDVTAVAVWREIEPEPVNVMLDLTTLGNGETYKIIAGGVYTLSGIASNAKIVIDSDYDVTLKLKNAYLTCESGNAIECVSAASLTIQALTSSVSLISAKDGGIVSAADLSIIGNGNVTFTTKDGIRSSGNIVFDANNSYLAVTSDGSGIVAEGGILVASGRLDIESVDTAVKAGTNFTMDGGEVILNSSAGNGIKSPDGVTVNGGKLMITSASEGVIANGVTLNGGVTEVTSDSVGIVSLDSVKLSDSELTVYSGSIGVHAYTAFEAANSKVYIISGGSAVLPPSYDANGNRIPTTAITASSVTVTGGKVEATSTQYAFDTNSVRIRNAIVRLTSSEDAVFAGGDASFTDCDIQIRAGLSFRKDASPLSRHGINVSGSVEFTGGSVEIRSADDCVFAGSINAIGTEFTLETDDTAIHVSDTAVFGACNMEIQDSGIGICAGSVEMRSTDADVNAVTTSVMTVSNTAADGSLTVSGGEIRLCAGETALLVNGDVNMSGGLLLAFSKSTTASALVCLGTKTVSSGTIAAFDMSDSNYSGNGFYCSLSNTVKHGTLVCVSGGSFSLILYPAYSFRSVLVLSGDMSVGTTYTLLTDGKYTGTETYNVLTGGTYTPGTPVVSATYKA
ncbi:MAG: InlB B-repeat-containing protein [Clostridia bacterium]|nr:InlB B-repeat-containing protein [Clostridia bacterium]